MIPPSSSVTLNPLSVFFSGYLASAPASAIYCDWARLIEGCGLPDEILAVYIYVHGSRNMPLYEFLRCPGINRYV